MAMEKFDRITHDPDVMGGRACIRGMRVTASLVLNLLASGANTEEITQAYPYMEAEDIRQAQKYAAWLSEESIPPPESAEIRKEIEVTDRLNKLYSKDPSGLDEDMARMQWVSLPREDW